MHPNYRKQVAVKGTSRGQMFSINAPTHDDMTSFSEHISDCSMALKCTFLISCSSWVLGLDTDCLVLTIRCGTVAVVVPSVPSNRKLSLRSL
jgi:hypothetical protein